MSPLDKPEKKLLREMGMLMPVRALALLLLAATAQAPCTWEGGPGCPDPTTPCVDWLGDTPAVDCVNSCDQLGANDIYCIASWVHLASADGECTYDMYATAGFDFLNNPDLVTVCDILAPSAQPAPPSCGYNEHHWDWGPECRDEYEARNHNHDSHPAVTYECCRDVCEAESVPCRDDSADCTTVSSAFSYEVDSDSAPDECPAADGGTLHFQLADLRVSDLDDPQVIAPDDFLVAIVAFEEDWSLDDFSVPNT